MKGAPARSAALVGALHPLDPSACASFSAPSTAGLSWEFGPGNTTGPGGKTRPEEEPLISRFSFTLLASLLSFLFTGHSCLRRCFKWLLVAKSF